MMTVQRSANGSTIEAFFINNQDGCPLRVLHFIALIGCTSVQLSQDPFWSVKLITPPPEISRLFQTKIANRSGYIRRCHRIPMYKVKQRFGGKHFLRGDMAFALLPTFFGKSVRE